MPMKDPVIASDGRTYERSAITQWLTQHSTSPLTREPMSITGLQTNYSVKAMLDRYNSNVTTIAPISVAKQSTYYQTLPAAPVVDIVVQPPQQRNSKQMLQCMCIALVGIIIIIIISKLIANS